MCGTIDFITVLCYYKENLAENTDRLIKSVFEDVIIC